MTALHLSYLTIIQYVTSATISSPLLMIKPEYLKLSVLELDLQQYKLHHQPYRSSH